MAIKVAEIVAPHAGQDRVVDVIDVIPITVAIDVAEVARLFFLTLNLPCISLDKYSISENNKEIIIDDSKIVIKSSGVR